MLYVTALALVIGALIGRVGGGQWRHLTEHRMQAWGLVIAGFGLQVAADHLSSHRLGTGLTVAGSGALLLFAFVNRHLVGMGIVAAGVAANAVVIGLNGGMPVRPAAVVAAHIATWDDEVLIGYGYRHHRERPSDRAVFLSDVIPIPEVHEVISFGDLILAVGVAVTIVHLLAPRKRHSPAVAQATRPPGGGKQHPRHSRPARRRR